LLACAVVAAVAGQKAALRVRVGVAGSAPATTWRDNNSIKHKICHRSGFIAVVAYFESWSDVYRCRMRGVGAFWLVRLTNDQSETRVESQDAKLTTNTHRNDDNDLYSWKCYSKGRREVI